MRKKILFWLIIVIGQISYGQLPCPNIISPMNGDTNVSIDATISWNGIIGAPAYLISIGTSPDGFDILNNQNVGNATSYTPTMGLPENTTLYVTITIFFFDAENIVCNSEMFHTESITEPPSCTSPIYPFDESTNVNIASSISWNYAPSATGYFLSLGTTPGGTELLDNENIVGALSYQPTFEFEVETEIYATIIPYNTIGPALELCQEYSFTTGAMVTIPGCTSLVNPLNGAINVELSPVLEWDAVPDASGYRVTVGTTPFNANVLDEVTFIQNSTLILDFEPNLTFFITIIPFNAAGEALNCSQESFSTVLGCGPYFDTITNQLVDLRPENNIPDIIPFCQNETPFNITSDVDADGFRWFKLDQNDNQQLISSINEVALTDPGRYGFETYNLIMQSGVTIECSNYKIFEVTSSEIATIDELIVTGQNGTIDVSVQITGNGDYEFAVDLIDGAYQTSNIFQNLEPGLHTFYVRDKNGCGIAEASVEQDLTLEGFPKFFTPNGDGVNDFWQFIPPVEGSSPLAEKIDIYNRYGMLLAQIDPNTKGWDGSFNGAPVQSSEYWFKTVSLKNKVIHGHFALKR